MNHSSDGRRKPNVDGRPESRAARPADEGMSMWVGADGPKRATAESGGDGSQGQLEPRPQGGSEGDAGGGGDRGDTGAEAASNRRRWMRATAEIGGIRGMSSRLAVETSPKTGSPAGACSDG